jgi:hypothetical protein
MSETASSHNSASYAVQPEPTCLLNASCGYLLLHSSTSYGQAENCLAAL